MQEILATFGIDWRLLLIHSLNFGILLLALWYFLYGPLMRMLEERRSRVEQGMRDAAAAQEKLVEIESSRDTVLANAGKEADASLVAARAAGARREQELVREGEAAAAALLREAEAEAAELKARAIEESKKEVAKLIVLGMEKILQQPSGQVKS
jgi:F-type H+-transporting ATPase subunit b